MNFEPEFQEPKSGKDSALKKWENIMDFLLNTKGNVFNDMIVTMKYIQNLRTGDGKRNLKLLKSYL